MALVFDPIQSGEDGGSVRSKLNDAITALVNFANNPSEDISQSKWEAEGEGAIKPKEDKGVKAPSLDVGNGRLVANSNGVDVETVVFTSQNASDLLGKEPSENRIVRPTRGKISILEVSDRVLADKLFIDDAKTESGTQYLKIDTEGRVFSELQDVGYTLTVQLTGASNWANVTGTIFILGPPNHGGDIDGSTNVFEGVKNGMYHVMVFADGFLSESEHVVIDGANETVTIDLTSFTVDSGGGGFEIIESTAPKSVVSADSVMVARPTSPSENMVFSIPSASENPNREFTFRKDFAGYAMSLVCVNGSDSVFLNGSGGDVLTTDETGAWVRVKSDGQDWHVIMDSGKWNVHNE